MYHEIGIFYGNVCITRLYHEVGIFNGTVSRDFATGIVALGWDFPYWDCSNRLGFSYCDCCNRSGTFLTYLLFSAVVRKCLTVDEQWLPERKCAIGIVELY